VNPNFDDTVPVLAFDTSTEWLAVALQRDGVVWQRVETGGARASQRLLPLVQELLREAAVELDQLGLIAFGAGPGAFTGLRAACAAAQGLAWGLGLPVVPVNTLLAVAAGQHDAAQVLVADDARMGELYWALAECIDGVWRLRQPPRVDAPAAAAQAWAALGAPPPCLAGNAWREHRDSLAAELPTAWHEALRDARDAAPSAPAIAQLARAAARRGEAVDATHALPLYVRDKVALTSAERAAAARGGRP
jgi:tRNA threonylcarbamoyladenosine biosynthesis protein TsaB